MVSANTPRLSSEAATPQIKSPATSIRWGATPSPMYSPRGSVEIAHTTGGYAFLTRTRSPVSRPASRQVSRPTSKSGAAPVAAKKEKKTGLIAKIKKSIDRSTQDYWGNPTMNLAYSGTSARI